MTITVSSRKPKAPHTTTVKEVSELKNILLLGKELAELLVGKSPQERRVLIGNIIESSKNVTVSSVDDLEISNFSNERSFDKYTAKIIVEKYLASKNQPSSKVLFGLSGNQRIFVKDIPEQQHFFFYTFNNGSLPAILISRLDAAFYKGDNPEKRIFEGHELNHEIISKTEYATSLNRKELRVNSNTLIIELIVDGQQRVTMILIMFDGSYNDGNSILYPHYDLDAFEVNGDNVKATLTSYVFLDNQGADHTKKMNNKNDHDIFLKHFLHSLDKNEEVKLNNYFPCSAVRGWEDMTEHQILAELMDKYRIIVLTDRKENYLKIIRALKKYYFEYNILSGQITENTTHEEITRSFTNNNTSATKVSESELVTGYFNEALGKRMEDLISQLAKLFLYFGVSDVREARDFGMRLIMTTMDWKTNIDRTLKDVKDPKQLDICVRQFEPLIGDFSKASIDMKELLKVDGKLDPCLDAWLTKGIVDDGRIAVFVVFVYYQVYHGNKNGKSYFQKDNLRHFKYLWSLIILQNSFSDNFGIEKSNLWDKVRTVAQTIMKHGTFNYDSLYLGYEATQSSVFTKIDDSFLITPRKGNDYAWLYGAQFVTPGKDIIPRSFLRSDSNIEHIIATANVKNWTTYYALLKSEGKVGTFDPSDSSKDIEIAKETQRFALAYNNTISNKVVLAPDLNKAFKDKTIKGKIDYMPANKRDEFRKLINVDKLENVCDITHIGSEPLFLLVSYLYHIRRIEAGRTHYVLKMTSSFKKKHDIKEFQTLDNDTILNQFIGHTCYDVDDIDRQGCKYPLVEKKLRKDFNEIQHLLPVKSSEKED